MKEKMKIRIRIDQHTLLQRQSFLEICYASTWPHFGSSVSTGIWRRFLPEGKKSTARMKRTGLLLCVRCTMKLLLYSQLWTWTAVTHLARPPCTRQHFFWTILGLWICSWLTTHNHKDNHDWAPVMSAIFWRKKADPLRELVSHPSVDLGLDLCWPEWFKVWKELKRICKVDLTSDYDLWNGELKSLKVHWLKLLRFTKSLLARTWL